MNLKQNQKSNFGSNFSVESRKRDERVSVERTSEVLEL